MHCTVPVKKKSNINVRKSESEMIWLYNHLNWNQGSSSWRFYWMGLNDLQVQGQLEWISTGENNKIEFKYNNFAGDAEMHDSSRRCTFSLFSNNLPADYGNEGKWYKEKCEKTKGLSYICKINENDVIRDCPSGYDNVQFGYDRICLKLLTSKRPWIEAEQYCQKDNGNLVHLRHVLTPYLRCYFVIFSVNT